MGVMFPSLLITARADKNLSTAESADPGVNPDCIHSHYRQKPKQQWVGVGGDSDFRRFTVRNLVF